MVVIMLLLLLVLDVVVGIGILVIVVGGFFDGCGLVVVLCYGVVGVVMGIWFLFILDFIVFDVVKWCYL